jgi:hypothetical protein
MTVGKKCVGAKAWRRKVFLENALQFSLKILRFELGLFHVFKLAALRVFN